MHYRVAVASGEALGQYEHNICIGVRVGSKIEQDEKTMTSSPTRQSRHILRKKITQAANNQALSQLS
jgi:hypothetical protein